MPNKEEAMYAEAFRELEEEEEGFFSNFSTELKSLKPARKSIQRDFEGIAAADTEAAKKTGQSKAGTARVAVKKAITGRLAAKKAGTAKVAAKKAGIVRVHAKKSGTVKVHVKKSGTVKGVADKTGIIKSSTSKPTV